MRRLLLQVLMFTFLLGLFGCQSKKERIHVRIQNNSVKDIAYFWLGAGSGNGGQRNRSYGSIPVGSTTDYKSLEQTYGAYGNFNFTTADDSRYTVSIFANEDIGDAELEPGYYTYSITIEEETVVLKIINEGTPTP